jgi:hypothetical protein
MMIHALVRGLFEALAEQKRKHHIHRMRLFKEFWDGILHHG